MRAGPRAGMTPRGRYQKSGRPYRHDGRGRRIEPDDDLRQDRRQAGHRPPAGNRREATKTSSCPTTPNTSFRGSVPRASGPAISWVRWPTEYATTPRSLRPRARRPHREEPEHFNREPGRPSDRRVRSSWSPRARPWISIDRADQIPSRRITRRPGRPNESPHSSGDPRLLERRVDDGRGGRCNPAALTSPTTPMISPSILWVPRGVHSEQCPIASPSGQNGGHGSADDQQPAAPRSIACPEAPPSRTGMPSSEIVGGDDPSGWRRRSRRQRQSVGPRP